MILGEQTLKEDSDELRRLREKRDEVENSPASAAAMR
jgi:hypothetical protein